MEGGQLDIPVCFIACVVDRNQCGLNDIGCLILSISDDEESPKLFVSFLVLSGELSKYAMYRCV